MNSITDWYLDLSDKDQLAVKIFIPLVTTLLMVFAVILPVNKAINSLETSIADNKEAIVILQNTVPQQAANSSSKSSLRTILINSTRQASLDIQRYEEKKDGELNVWFEQVAFDELMIWLAKLNNQSSVNTSYVSINQTKETGRVRANIRLISE
ncbi:MAG: type II secretion system protein GspM [Kangiellaceae bacterium]|jgi:type II secretory pathway component PulM|nr:type II secretion system protein GspM [Kangiellaceae bacterium]